MSNIPSKKIKETESTNLDFSRLPVHQLKAIQLKYEGKTYNAIVQELNAEFELDVPESTLKYWFAKNGKLSPYYQDYSEYMNTEALMEARNILTGNITAALAALGKAMKGGGTRSVQAAKIWLDKALPILRTQEQYQKDEQITFIGQQANIGQIKYAQDGEDIRERLQEGVSSLRRAIEELEANRPKSSGRDPHAPDPVYFGTVEEIRSGKKEIPSCRL